MLLFLPRHVVQANLKHWPPCRKKCPSARQSCPRQRHGVEHQKKDNYGMQRKIDKNPYFARFARSESKEKRIKQTASGSLVSAPPATSLLPLYASVATLGRVLIEVAGKIKGKEGRYRFWKLLYTILFYMVHVQWSSNVFLKFHHIRIAKAPAWLFLPFWTWKNGRNLIFSEKMWNSWRWIPPVPSPMFRTRQNAWRIPPLSLPSQTACQTLRNQEHSHSFLNDPQNVENKIR